MVSGVFNSWSGFYGGSLGDVLAHWEEIGVFSYVLPFLLIFALTFAVISRLKLFEKNRGVNVVIALAVGFMSLQFDFVPRFFSEVFPRLGIGLGVLLVFVVLIGMFKDTSHDEKFLNGIMVVVGIVVAIVVLVNAAGSLGWETGYWWQENWGTVLGVVVFVLIIGAIVFSGGGDDKGFTLKTRE